MSGIGEYWRDVKEHYRNKQKKLKPIYDQLLERPDCKEIGDQHRIDDWDFWCTGTVRNYKTGERTTLKKLINLLDNK